MARQLCVAARVWLIQNGMASSVCLVSTDDHAALVGLKYCPFAATREYIPFHWDSHDGHPKKLSVDLTIGRQALNLGCL